MPEEFCRSGQCMILAAAALSDEHTIVENSMKGFGEKSRRKTQRSGRNDRNQELLLDWCLPHKFLHFSFGNNQTIIIRGFSQIDDCHTTIFYTFLLETITIWRSNFCRLKGKQIILKFFKTNENETGDKGDEWSAYLECVGVVEHLVPWEVKSLVWLNIEGWCSQ